MQQIKYYAMLVDTTGSNKTPKYTITKSVGAYPQMEALRGKDGNISLYLMENRSSKIDAPAMKLQGKGSLNLTGLKDYFVDGKISGYAYGYPSDKPTYGKDEKPNPFYDCKDDAFLFKIHHEEGSPRPQKIEMLVLDKQRICAAAYCKSLMMGGFDEELSMLRGMTK